jgi:hypothetical protein
VSTILDALQKARREHPHEGAGDSLGRLAAVQAAPPRRVPRRSVAAVIGLTVVATMLTLLLVGGAFVLLQKRMQWLVAPPRAGAAVAPVTPGIGVAPTPAEPAAAGRAQDGSPATFAVADGPVSASVELPVVGPVRSADPAVLLPPPAPAAQVPPAVTPQPAAATPAAGNEGFTLGSILYDDQVRIATVNGIALREGEEYGGMRVLRIMRDSVIVQRDRDDPVTLRLAR